MFNSYQPNLDNLQQYMNQENEKNAAGSGPNWWSIPAGSSAIRILPPWDPTGRVALPVYMHPIEYQSAEMKYKKYNWTCVNRTFNKPCPICEGLMNLSAAGVDISSWEANRRQFYFNAIVMHDPNYNPQKNTGTAPGTHVLLKAPKTFYDWVIAQITDPMIGDITSITNGIDIYIKKEGTGLGTSYTMTLSPNGRQPVPQEYLEKITNLYNLDEIFSAGFDQKQIDDLVDHLRKSAGVMGSAVSGMQQQMAGYTQAPTPQTYNPMNVSNQPHVQAPSPFNQAPSPFTQTSAMPMQAPSPFTSAGVPPFDVSSGPVFQNPAPVTPAPVQKPASAMPKCFGQYDSGNVNCVVCPHEMDCARTKNG